MVSWLRGLITSIGPRSVGRTVEESMRQVQAATVAYQQQLEAQRVAHERLELDEQVLVDEDTAKAFAAVETAWLEATPVQPSVSRLQFFWCLVAATVWPLRTFALKRRLHMRRPYR